MISTTEPGFNRTQLDVKTIDKDTNTLTVPI